MEGAVGGKVTGPLGRTADHDGGKDEMMSVMRMERDHEGEGDLVGGSVQCLLARDQEPRWSLHPAQDKNMYSCDIVFYLPQNANFNRNCDFT